MFVETLRKICVSIKFLHQKIRWNTVFYVGGVNNIIKISFRVIFLLVFITVKFLNFGSSCIVAMLCYIRLSYFLKRLGINGVSTAYLGWSFF